MTTRTASLAVLASLYASTAPLSIADETTTPRPQGDGPGVIFSSLLPDLPGRRLVAVALQFDPKSHNQLGPHRHPGSVFVYVTKGTVRLGIAGQPVRLVHAGETFFEPAGALHTVSESASATETASAIAVLVVPDGAPLHTVDGPTQ